MTRHVSAILLVRPRWPGASECAWGPWGLLLWPEWSHQSPYVTQRKAGSLQGVHELWPQPPAHPQGNGVSTGSRKHYRMWKTQRGSHAGPVSDHVEYSVTGSPTACSRWVETTDKLDSRHYCRTYTRHFSPFSVFMCLLILYL